MQKDRKRILKMLAKGKITVDEAERLINALHESNPITESAGNGGAPRKDKPKFLRIEVNEKHGDRVNIRVPMALLSSGLNFAKFIPGVAKKHVDDALKDKGVDLNLNSSDTKNMNGIISALENLEIDIDEKNGDKVRIHCE